MGMTEFSFTLFCDFRLSNEGLMNYLRSQLTDFAITSQEGRFLQSHTSTFRLEIQTKTKSPTTEYSIKFCS